MSKDKKEISPIEVVKFLDCLDCLPYKVLEEVVASVIEEWEKRNNQSFHC